MSRHGRVGTRDLNELDPRKLWRSVGPTPRALICVNKASRRGGLGIELAAERLIAAGFHMIDGDCASAGDLSDCIIAHRDKVDCVVLAGGDGTINAAGRGLVESGLPLGLIPTGTANDFARSMGLPSDQADAAQVIVDGATHPIDVGDVNGHCFFNVASVGIAADLAKSLTGDEKRRFGRMSYALSALRVLSRANPFHATLLIGDRKIRVRTLQIAVGNGRFYGGGNLIASDARIDDGYLDLYSLEFAQVWRMALMVRSFKAGSHGAMQEVRTARGATFEIVTRKPRSVNADGEIVTKTPAVFTQKASRIQVFVPRNGAMNVPLRA